MGTDIHAVWQRKTDAGWQDIAANYESDRHYQLFAVLADVRNGYGFAGVPTGEAIHPISSPRGLPTDFWMVDGDHPIERELADEWERKYHRAEDGVISRWMGDHSHSWLLGSEMLAWKAPMVRKVGVLSAAQYVAWDKVSRPKEYCGDIWGKDLVTVTEAETKTVPYWTHVRVSWHSALDEELAYFFNEVRRLMDAYGEIRFVFGFDS